MTNEKFLKEAISKLNPKEDIYFTKKENETGKIVKDLAKIDFKELNEMEFSNEEEYFTLIFTDKCGIKCAWMSCPISQSENISSKLAKYLFEGKGEKKYEIDQVRINRD